MPDGSGEPRQTRLVAFLDDASRLCCHGEFFHEETTTTLKATLKAALYKRGVPQTLYVDNGSIYAGRDITLICGRLGILLCHTPVRDAAAKGKVERFFRTVRDVNARRELTHFRPSRIDPPRGDYRRGDLVVEAPFVAGSRATEPGKSPAWRFSRRR